MHELNEAVQHTVDRIHFLRIAEDCLPEKRRIEAAGRQIDALVNGLCRLAEEEIAIVEAAAGR